MSGKTLNADMLSLELIDENGVTWGKFVCTSTIFKSGNLGFMVREKITDPYDVMNRFQVNVNITLIGSKKDGTPFTDT